MLDLALPYLLMEQTACRDYVVNEMMWGLVQRILHLGKSASLQGSVNRCIWCPLKEKFHFSLH